MNAITRGKRFVVTPVVMGDETGWRVTDLVTGEFAGVPWRTYEMAQSYADVCEQREKVA